jgi:hypothetical protein
MSGNRDFHPNNRKQSVLPIAGGLLAGGLIGAGLTIVLRYALADHVGITPWLQAVANLAIVIAAVFAGWAALIARGSFKSQKSAADRQLELADKTDGSTRHHASILLLWRFKDEWESDTMLRWRSELAEGLLKRHDEGSNELIPKSRLALGVLANFIDFAGYCARNNLLFVSDAFTKFAYYWELYWFDCMDVVKPKPGNVAGLWEDANWLMNEFAKLEEGGVALSLPGDQIVKFLLGERDIARVEKTVLAEAVLPEAPGTGSSISPGSSGPPVAAEAAVPPPPPPPPPYTPLRGGDAQ